MVAFRYLSAVFVLQERKQASETAGNRYSISQCSCISVLLQEITSDAIRTDLSPFLMNGKGRGGGAYTCTFKEFIGIWYCLLNDIWREKLNLSVYGFVTKALGRKREKRFKSNFCSFFANRVAGCSPL